MLDLEQYEAFEQALAAADRAGATPLRWSLTSSIYENFDLGRDHFMAAQRAIHGAEPPRPFYGLPVEIALNAFNKWHLITDRGTYGREGFVEYSTKISSHGPPADKP